MKYRRFGKSGWEISEVSIGVLRKEEAIAFSDGAARAERVRAIRHAIDRGVNYINLGYPFNFEDPQEACGYVKEALADGYGGKVRVAVNIPARGLSSYKDLEKALDAQLRLFSIEKADFCVLCGVNSIVWDKIKSIDIESWAAGAIDSGKADHIGMGFHDDPHYLKRILDACRQWAFIEIELSIVDYKHHPGVGCFNFAKERDIAVIAADVSKAGRLLKNIPESIQEILNGSRAEMTQEERCIRWALGFEDISSAQMSSTAEFSAVEQVERYLDFAGRFSPGGIDMQEMLDAAKIRDAYYASRDCLCTGCRRCMPCPAGIDAPRIIELVNEEKMFSDSEIPKLQYNLENHRQTKCAQCGICVQRCKKHFPVGEIVKQAYERYA